MSNKYTPLSNTSGRYVPVSTPKTNSVNPFDAPSPFASMGKPSDIIPSKTTPPTSATPLATGPRIPELSPGPLVNTANGLERLPASVISQGGTRPAEQPSIWNKIAKTLLPKPAEDFFGLNNSQVKKDIVKQQADIEAYKKDTLLNKTINEVPSIAMARDKNYQTPAQKKLLATLNSPTVAPVIKSIAERTSGTGIYDTMISAGPKKFDEAYAATRAYQAGDTSKLNQFKYQLLDTAPQTLVGVALSFVPFAGKPLATAYWTALSASEQQANRGKVTSTTNLGIDVALDSVLGGTIESLFKKPTKTLLSTLAKTFTAEGGTELTQDILKMSNDYHEAKSDAERQAAIQAGKDYFTSGQALMTFGVGGVTGAGVGTGAYALNKYAPETAEKLVENADKNIKLQNNYPAGLSVKDVTSGTGAPEVLYSGAKGQVTPAEVDLSTKRIATIQGDQRSLTNSSSYVEADQKLFDKYSGDYDFVKIEHPEMPSKGDEYYNLNERTWYSKDKDVAEVYAMQNRDAKYGVPEEQKEDMWENSYPLQGPGYQKLVSFVDKMEQSGTILPEEAPIIKALFEDTNDDFLKILNLSESGRLTRTPGNFKITQSGLTGLYNKNTNLLTMRKGLARKTEGSSLSTFLHEYGHAGYYLVLNEAERAQVQAVYDSINRSEKKSLFSHFPADDSQNYYTKDAQEFWAQSFADYVMENKVSDKLLEPLLKKISRRFFEVLKRIINRGNPEIIVPMKPMFERILDGNWNSPLTEYVNKEPSSFKPELQALLKRVAPEVSAITEEAKKPLFTGSEKTNIPTTPEVAPVEESIPEEKTPENIPSFEREVTKKGNTPLEKRVRWTDLLRTPWKVLDKIGLRKPYQVLLESYENYVSELPGNIDKITAWSKRVAPESNERIFRFLDGEKNIQLEGEEIVVSKEIKDWLSQWADRLGMTPDERISEYITHIFPIDSKGEIPEELAVLIDKKVAKSVYDPFLLQRQGAEGYLKDTWKALDAYVKRGTRKANMDPALLAFDEASKKLTDVSQLNYVERYISRINMRPTETDTQLDNEIKSRFGYFFGARPVNNITRLVRQTISRAKIGGSLTSFAKNLTQGVNTFAELGTKYTLRGYLGLAKKGAAAELEENNVMMGSFVEDRTYSAIKKAAELADKVLFLNMQASENVNRGAAYFGAKAKFADGKVTPREFREALGRNMPDNYQPTMEDAIEYGKFISGKTQFRFDPLETPMALSSDIAKTAAQFQTFGIKQAEFILGMANKKDIGKLFRYLLSSMLLFHFIGSAFGMSWDDSFKTLRWGMPPAIQFLIDLWKGGVLGEDKYGNKLDAGQRAGLVGKSLFTNVVPAGAQMMRTYEGVSTVNQGASRNKSGKFEYKVDQTPSNYLRGTLFGKYNLPQSKDYYEKKENNKNKAKPSGASRYTPI